MCGLFSKGFVVINWSWLLEVDYFLSFIFKVIFCLKLQWIKCCPLPNGLPSGSSAKLLAKAQPEFPEKQQNQYQYENLLFDMPILEIFVWAVSKGKVSIEDVYSRPSVTQKIYYDFSCHFCSASYQGNICFDQ